MLDDGTDTGTWTRELGERTVGWRPACDCGWRSPDYWARADWPSPQGWPPEALEGDDGGATERQWHAHLQQALPELAIHDLARQIEDLRAELEHAVATARQAGAGWQTIGHAAGISRQAAHERWSSSTPTSP